MTDGFKEIDNVYHTSQEGFSHIQISYTGSTTAYGVAFFEGQKSLLLIKLIKFTETAALDTLL